MKQMKAVERVPGEGVDLTTALDVMGAAGDDACAAVADDIAVKHSSQPDNSTWKESQPTTNQHHLRHLRSHMISKGLLE